MCTVQDFVDLLSHLFDGYCTSYVKNNHSTIYVPQNIYTKPGGNEASKYFNYTDRLRKCYCLLSLTAIALLVFFSSWSLFYFSEFINYKAYNILLLIFREILNSVVKMNTYMCIKSCASLCIIILYKVENVVME